VKGLVSHGNGKTLEIIEESLLEEGYEVHYRILDAADFGVPQVRKRIYIVGFDRSRYRGDINFKWPTPNKRRVGIGKFVEKDVKDRPISKHLQKSYIFKVDDGRPEIIDTSSKFPVKTLVASYYKIQRLTGTFVADGPTGLRLLTANECKAIMGYPKSFKLPVSRTQMYRQMGNSVAVPVVRKVAAEIVSSLEQARLFKKVAKRAAS
jgi:DNA (cytosine-5)-methyltransferase 1